MTPQEHYAEAERLLDAATNEHGVPLHATRIAAAQAHATLAVAAATGLAGSAAQAIVWIDMLTPPPVQVRV